MASTPIACPRETTDKRRTTTTNSSSSHHHDSAPSRPHSLICTGAEPIHPVHASSQLGRAAVAPRNEVIFLPFWRVFPFSIFVADLIHELQTKFPHAVINLAPGLQHNGTTQIWIGRLLYVDDLALMSTCPRELQTMLHVCRNGVFEIVCRSTHRRQRSWLFSRPHPFKRIVVTSTDPAQPYPPSTSTRPSQPPPLSLTSVLRYSNLNT